MHRRDEAEEEGREDQDVPEEYILIPWPSPLLGLATLELQEENPGRFLFMAVGITGFSGG